MEAAQSHMGLLMLHSLNVGDCKAILFAYCHLSLLGKTYAVLLLSWSLCAVRKKVSFTRNIIMSDFAELGSTDLRNSQPIP